MKKPLKHGCCVIAAAHQLDCHFLLILSVGADCPVDLAHASIADFRLNLVDADSPSNPSGPARFPESALQIHCRTVQENAAGLLVRLQKRFDLAAKFGIIRADFVEIH